MHKTIFLISFEYFPISQAGLARHAKAMIDRLLKYRGFKAIIAVPKNNKIKLNKDIFTIPCVFFDNKYLCCLEFSLRVLFRLKGRFNLDSFVVFSPFSYFLFPILPKEFYLFVHSNGKRAFFTNYPGENIKDRLLRKLLYFFIYQWEMYLCKKAKKIFSVSQSLKDETVYQYNLNKNKIIVINNGLDTNIFRKRVEPKILTKDLLYVGKISYRKNVLDLINILKLLTGIDPQFKLHIMGTSDRGYLHKIKSKITEYKLNDRVLFYNYTSDVELNKLYEKCSLFVTTSLLEGFGLVLLEAMGKGMPVIAYDNLGFRDIIVNETCGHLVKPFDYQGLVNKIIYLYKNKDLYKKMAENALKKVDNFSWDRSVSKLVKELQ